LPYAGNTNTFAHTKVLDENVPTFPLIPDAETASTRLRLNLPNLRDRRE